MKNFIGILLLLCFCSYSFAYEGMVVSEHKLASAAGVRILQEGGNAIDAAVAVGYALAVVNSCCGNLGGGGFMTIHLTNGKNLFINFRERAPLNATADMYVHAAKNSSIDGYLAVATPGTVLGLDTALQHFGKLSRKKVMQPAIELAEKGYRLTAYEATLLNENSQDFAKQPNVAAIFMHHAAGDLLVQPQLANSLKKIAAQGPAAFYKGSIAAAIVEASTQAKGILSKRDFEQYSVQIKEPIECVYRGYKIISANLPSSGGIALCEMLNILENFPLQQIGFNQVESVHLIIQAMRYAYIDRNSKLGDPDFVKNPSAELLSKLYAKKLSEKILQSPFNPLPAPVNNLELTDTTHFSVLDKEGNAVAVTYTLNGFFGAKVIAGDTGFFLNDEMDDFATLPNQPNKFGLVQSSTNEVAPGKRPLSSMAPTIILKDNKVVMVLGSPGGPRIISSILLTILNKFDFDMSLQDAIATPRYHYQVIPNVIFLEPGALNLYIELVLEFFNYHFQQTTTWSAVEAIYIDPTTGKMSAVNDPRRPDGAALPAK